MFDLTGKKALVTGSSQGIGKEIAKALAMHGAFVYVHGTNQSEKLTQAAEYVKERGKATVQAVSADLLQPDAAECLYRQTGDVDILVLNASIQIRKAWSEYTAQEVHNQINCNLVSSYFLIQKYISGMQQKHWGRILTIGSTNQYNNHPQLSIYGVTKAAQMKLVQNIAPYIAAEGITINNIAPGAIATPRNEDVFADEQLLRKVKEKIPAGFIGDAKDMNEVALLLCSEEGRYITGSELIVDGGMHL